MKRVSHGIKQNMLRIAATVVVLSISFPITGCSELLNDFAVKRVEEYSETFFEDLDADGFCSDVSDNSDEDIDIPTLTDEQMSLFSCAFDNFSYEIKNVTVNDNRDKANVKVKIKYIDFETACEGSFVAEQSEFEEIIDDASTVSKTVTLKAVKSDSGWVFQDLSVLTELMYDSFAEPCVLDESGNPINVNSYYLTGTIVGCFWYDPLMGNPMESNSVSNPVALRAVFYFDGLQTYSYTAELVCDNEVIAETEVSVDNDIIAVCDFDPDTIGIQSFSAGEYVVELFYNGQAVYSSDTLSVT